MKNVLQLLSSLLLPLMLGIFTVVITFHQQKAAQQQRQEDRQAAEQLRDLERNLNDERYHNDVINTYIIDIAALLKENDGSLTSNSVMSTLARIKTLNVFRQLDSQRNMRVMRFLYEAKQLTGTEKQTSLDLSTAELSDIDFRNIAVNKKNLGHISLAGVLLSNVTFMDLEIEHANFSSSRFENADFLKTTFSQVDASFALFNVVNWASTKFQKVNFSFTKLGNVDVSSAFLENVDISSADLQRIRFGFVQLFDVSFAYTKLSDIDFTFAILRNVDFSFAQLRNVNFSCAQLQNVTFSYAKLYKVDFSMVKPNGHYMRDIYFDSAILDQVDFSFTKLDIVTFSYSQQIHVNFSYTILGKLRTFHTVLFQGIPSSTFVLASAVFFNAKIVETNFERARCLKAEFRVAKIFKTQFWQANVKGANFYRAGLNNVNFSLANLQKADLSNTSIMDSQLRSALSIQDAQLPNGSYARDPNLIRNGEAHCNISFVTHWKIQTGEIRVVLFDKNASDCHFALHTHDTGATMWQRIDLPQFSRVHFYPSSKLVLSARIGTGVFIQLIGRTRSRMVFARNNLSKFKCYSN